MNVYGLGVCNKGLDLSSSASDSRGYADMLINMYPKEGDLILRKGSTTAFTLQGATPIQTLHTHISTARRETLIVCAGGGIYQVQGGAINTANPLALFSIPNAEWVTCQFGYETGRSFFVNGTNPPQVFDGSSMSTFKFGVAGGFTGGPSNPSDLSHVWSYKARLYFSDGANFYYGQPGEIQGNLSSPYRVSEFFTKGGNIIWGGSVSAQSGNVAQDLFAVLSSEGEMLLYAGESPEGSWSLISKLKFPKPVGRRCGYNYNGDLLILTVGGVFSVKESSANQSVTKAAALTKNVQDGIARAAVTSTPNHAWQIIEDDTRGHLLVNLPNTSLLTNTTSSVPNTYYNIETNSLGFLPPEYWSDARPGKTEQLVMNTTSRAWSMFKGWDALCWASYNGDIYYGTATGVVAKAHSGGTDLGADIPIVVTWADSSMGDPVRIKTFTQVSPMWKINGKLKFGWGIDTDFNDKTRLSSNTLMSGSLGFRWDTYKWSGWKWNKGILYSKKAYSIRGIGTSGSLSFQCYAKNVDITLSGVFVFFESGGIR